MRLHPLSSVPALKMRIAGRHTIDDLHELVTEWGLTSHRERPIARSMLPQLLSNPFYVGLFRFADETHDGTHQPLVTKALFDEVQNVMARRGRPHKPRRRPLPYIGSLQCGACGAAITGERQKDHHYYRCTRKPGPCSQKRFIREETLTDEFRCKTATVCIPKHGAEPVLAQFTEWRRTDADSRSAQLGDAKERLAAVENRLSRLLDVYIDGTVDHDDYARKKEELLHNKTTIKEAIGRIQSDGNAWLEPMASFLNDAIQAENTALTGKPEELVGFHRRIGSNLSLIEPERAEEGTDPETRASKERAATSAARHGGFAARASVGPASLPPSSRMTKAGSAFAKVPADRAWSEAEEAQVASPAVTSDACQAESIYERKIRLDSL
jgi:site-specific DNA recombinase